MDLLVHEEAYRSKNLLQKINAAPIFVCGCGALGSNLIDNMLRQGFKNISVIDFDRIEEHNRGTQIWDRAEIGFQKAEKMKWRAYASVGVTINSIPKRLDENNINKNIKPSHIVIDTFDETPSRGLVYDYCQKNKIECLHTGLFQDYAEVIWNEKYTVPKKTKGMDICEYPLARNIILLAVALTTEVIIKYIDSNEKENFTITLKDKKINKLEG